MRLIVNGRTHDFPAATLAEALACFLALEPRLAAQGAPVLATALNGEFVPRAQRDRTPLAPGDRIEILAPMQGG